MEAVCIVLERHSILITLKWGISLFCSSFIFTGTVQKGDRRFCSAFLMIIVPSQRFPADRKYLLAIGHFVQRQRKKTQSQTSLMTLYFKKKRYLSLQLIPTFQSSGSYGHWKWEHLQVNVSHQPALILKLWLLLWSPLQHPDEFMTHNLQMENYLDKVCLMNLCWEHSPFLSSPSFQLKKLSKSIWALFFTWSQAKEAKL